LMSSNASAKLRDSVWLVMDVGIGLIF
jgi:hypothetical protein